jgi:hypothetical protein
MYRAKRLALMTGIGLAAALWVGAQPAAAGADAGRSVSTPVVIRGSDPVATPPSTSPTTTAAPTVLRGAPLPAPQPRAARDACPSGYDYDPNYGCVTTGFADDAYDDGYWPYYGFDAYLRGGRRQNVRLGFTHDVGRGFMPRFGHGLGDRPFANRLSLRLASGPARGFAHPGGFGELSRR